MERRSHIQNPLIAPHMPPALRSSRAGASRRSARQIARRIAGMMQPTEKIRNFQPHRQSLVAQMPEISVRHDRTPSLRMLIFQLHQYHRAAMMDLLPAYDRQ